MNVAQLPAHLLATRIVDRTGEGESARDVLDRQLRFDIVGSGPFGSRRVVPASAAARAVLASADGKRLQASLQGLIGVLDAERGTAHVDGIDLAVDPRGAYALELTNQALAGGFRAGAGSRWDRFVQQSHADWSSTIDHYVPMCNYAVPARAGDEARVTIMPMLTQIYRAALGAGGEQRPAPAGWTPADGGNMLAGVFAHEIRHSVTPRSARPESAARFVAPNAWGSTSMWLEEGVTQALTSWPGAIARAATSMGLPSDESRIDETWRQVTAMMPDKRYAEMPPYRSYVAGVQHLLELAGIDVSDPASYEAADELLQRQAQGYVPQRIATAIARHHGLPHSAVARIRTAIVASRGDVTKIDAIASLVDRLAS